MRRRRGGLAGDRDLAPRVLEPGRERRCGGRLGGLVLRRRLGQVPEHAPEGRPDALLGLLREEAHDERVARARRGDVEKPLPLGLLESDLDAFAVVPIRGAPP